MREPFGAERAFAVAVDFEQPDEVIPFFVRSVMIEEERLGDGVLGVDPERGFIDFDGFRFEAEFLVEDGGDFSELCAFEFCVGREIDDGLEVVGEFFPGFLNGIKSFELISGSAA